MSRKHLVIPDTQVKPDVPLDHIVALGNYIVAKRPDVIIMIGDWFDLPSLSSYDRGTKKAEGRRLSEDIQAGIDAMEVLLAPLHALQKKQKKNKKKVYSPEMHFTLGNHEERLMRHVNFNPELAGYLSYDAFELERFGWTVHDFLKPVVVDGIAYAHYFANPMSGRPYGGNIMNKLNKIKISFTQGHQQVLEVGNTETPVGDRMWGLVAGSFYMHDEGYKGYQGNSHWRGIVMKHDVKNGDYSPCVVNMDYLLRKYL